MKLTIITVNLNNRQGLEDTISSVVAQTVSDFEHIIIDGGSTDGSTAVVDRYRHRLAYAISEPDTGIFDAMNKGIKAAKGEYLLMLNSGDRLASANVIETFFKATTDAQEDLIYGNLVWEDAGAAYQQVFPENISLAFFQHNGFLGHQATFIKRRLHQAIGYYDDNLRFAADWKFFLLAICRHTISYRRLALTVAVCDRTGISCQPQNLSAILQEKDIALLQHFSLPLLISAGPGKQHPTEIGTRTARALFESLFFVRAVMHH